MLLSYQLSATTFVEPSLRSEYFVQDKRSKIYIVPPKKEIYVVTPLVYAISAMLKK